MTRPSGCWRKADSFVTSREHCATELIEFPVAPKGMSDGILFSSKVANAEGIESSPGKRVVPERLKRWETVASHVDLPAGDRVVEL